VLWKCVEFAQDTISGLTLLELAGVNSGQPPQIYDWGGGAYTVCQLDHQPTPVPDKCFAKNMSDPNWSDSYVHNGAWTKRLVGVNGYSIADGDIEGWTYSSGYGSLPPSVQFSQVCPPPRAPTTAPAPLSTRPPAGPIASSTPSVATTLTAAPSPAIQALAPSVSPSIVTALASTGPPAQPPTAGPGPWLLLGVAVVVLTGLGAFNLRRRRS
jgi:hypothetical protein